jgi:hypothetical protein
MLLPLYWSRIGGLILVVTKHMLLLAAGCTAPETPFPRTVQDAQRLKRCFLLPFRMHSARTAFSSYHSGCAALKMPFPRTIRDAQRLKRRFLLPFRMHSARMAVSSYHSGCAALKMPFPRTIQDAQRLNDFTPYMPMTCRVCAPCL